MITFGKFHRQLLARAFDDLPVRFTGEVNDLEFFKQCAQVIQDSLVDGMRTFASAEHQKDRKLARDAKVLMGCLTVPKREVRAKRISGFVDSFVKELLRLFGRHCNDVCKAGK